MFRTHIFLVVSLFLTACDPYGPCTEPESTCDLKEEWGEVGQNKPWICEETTLTCTQTCTSHAVCASSPDEDVSAVPRCDTSVGSCILGCRPEAHTCPSGTTCVQNDTASLGATGYWGACTYVPEQ